MSVEKPTPDSIPPNIPAIVNESSHSCPINCPNRQTKAKQRVLGGGYLFALIVAMLLGLQCLDASYKRVHGEEDLLFSTKSPPSAMIIAGLTLIGLGLGIEIDKSMISSAAKSLLGGLGNSSKSEEN